MTTANAINASDLGLVRYQGSGNFDGVTTTQYNTLTGAASNGINNVSPGTSGQVLTSQGAGAYPVYADASAVTVTQFDASGTWTKKANTKSISIYIFNGGAGGGSGRRGASGAAGGGGGGGAGNAIFYQIPASFVGATETVTIGAGGLGGAAVTIDNTDGNNGTAPGATSFGNVTCNDPNNVLSCMGGAGNNGFASAGNGYTKNLYYGTGGGGTVGGGGLTTGGFPAGNTDVSSYGGGTGGGGGAGADSVTEYGGGQSGDIYDPMINSVVISGSPGGTESGTINGTAGTNQVTGSTAGGLIVSGTGGGGGGGQHVGLVAGNGGAGGIPGGGGGGGGGSLNGTNSGAGGDGGHGRVIIVEYA